MADVGRPTVMTPETISKLEEVFALGGTDVEACFFAGISKTTLYKFQEEHPEFADRKDALKQNPVLKARRTIEKAIETDVNTARWYVEKRDPDFNPRSQLDVTSGGDKVHAINYVVPDNQPSTDA